MFDENSFSLDSFDQDSWRFLLEVPYFDLTGKQRIFVRAVLESVYATTEVERIVSVAAQNNLSVIDAVTAIRVSAEPIQIIVRNERKSIAEKQARNPSRKTGQNNYKNGIGKVYARTIIETVFSHDVAQQIFVTATAENISIRKAADEVVVRVTRDVKSPGGIDNGL